jgi:hypothetical protein
MPATPKNYAAWLLEITPPWLRGTWGDPWAVSVGTLIDALVEGAHLAIRERWLRTASEAASYYAGRDSSIARGVGQSLEAYRTRLVQRWALWGAAGTKSGVGLSLLGLGFAGDDGTPDGVVTEGVGSDWWAFQVTISTVPDDTFKSTIPLWGSVVLDNFETYGAFDSPTTETTIYEAIRLAKSAHSQATDVRILDGADVYGSCVWGAAVLDSGTLHQLRSVL